MSAHKRQKLDITDVYFQSDLENKLKTLESLVQDYINKLYYLNDFYNKVGFGYIKDSINTTLEEIKILDECLYLRQSITDLITSIKQKISSIGNLDFENKINIKVNELYEVVMNKDFTLRLFLNILNPRLDLLINKGFLDDKNPYAFTYDPLPPLPPLPPYQPPPSNTNQNNTNRNTGSGIRRNRRP
jgi:hypothetical protein